MIETFLITIPKDNIIYRGVSDKNKTDGNWFAYSKDDALIYGSKILSYKLKKDLKFINIISGFFHIDYMDKLNLKYTGDNYDGNDTKKMLALFPIGLPKLDTQIELAKMLKYTIDTKEIKDNTFSFLSSYLYDLTRISDYNIDTIFSNEIMEIYANKCDGFTIPIKWPNKIQGGFFNREIYIQDTNNIELINTENNSISGGGIKIIKPINIFNSKEDLFTTMKNIQTQINKSLIDAPILMRAEQPIRIKMSKYSKTEIISKIRCVKRCKLLKEELIKKYCEVKEIIMLKAYNPVLLNELLFVKGFDIDDALKALDNGYAF